jgi:hypothetical protein
MILTWELSSNIENSLIEFLRTEVLNDSLQLLDQNGAAQSVNVYAGRTLNNNWNLPLIQVYLDSKPDASRLEIGDNKRLRSFQIVIDIRTLLPGQETNLGDWVEEVINDGFTVYDYTPNPLNVDAPIKSILYHGRVDFINSLPAPSWDDADIFDKNRYRITIKVWIN